MAIFIDVSAAVNGSGTEVDPHNVPPATMINDTFLFKRGTEYIPAAGSPECLFIGGAGNATIGSYGAGDYPMIVNSANRRIGLHIGSDAPNVTVMDDSIRIRNVGTGSDRRGIGNGTTGSSGTVVTNIHIGAIVVEQVHSDDNTTSCDGIQLFGANNSIIGATVDDIADDGIWFRGQNFTMKHCRVTRVHQSTITEGDCIQGSAAVADECLNFNITHNYLDHSDQAGKQAFIIVSPASGGGLFAFNEIYGHDDTDHTTVYIDCSNVIVMGNRITGGNVCISMVGITNFGGKVLGNICTNSFNRGIDLNQDGTLCANNTCVGEGQNVVGIRHSLTGATGVLIHNNIVKNFASTGIGMTTGASESHNCIYGAATSVQGGAAATTIVSDPQLNSDFSLKGWSRAVGAGLSMAGLRDHYGRAILGTPDMGAIQYYAARRTMQKARTK